MEKNQQDSQKNNLNVNTQTKISTNFQENIINGLIKFLDNQNKQKETNQN